MKKNEHIPLYLVSLGILSYNALVLNLFNRSQQCFRRFIKNPGKLTHYIIICIITIFSIILH